MCRSASRSVIHLHQRLERLDRVCARWHTSVRRRYAAHTRVCHQQSGASVDPALVGLKPTFLVSFTYCLVGYHCRFYMYEGVVNKNDVYTALPFNDSFWGAYGIQSLCLFCQCSCLLTFAALTLSTSTQVSTAAMSTACSRC